MVMAVVHSVQRRCSVRQRQCRRTSTARSGNASPNVVAAVVIRNPARTAYVGKTTAANPRVRRQPRLTNAVLRNCGPAGNQRWLLGKASTECSMLHANQPVRKVCNIASPLQVAGLPCFKGLNRVAAVEVVAIRLQR